MYRKENCKRASNRSGINNLQHRNLNVSTHVLYKYTWFVYKQGPVAT